MPNIKYITIPQSIAGLDTVFGGWLVRIKCPEAPYGEFVTLIDVGTATVAQDFITTLRKEGINHIDLILLSHIHGDHAGALADVLEAFPTAKAVCHTKGTRHLIDPSRLWESTKEVMRDLADMYGEPKPVPEERLIPFSPGELSPLPTNILPYSFPEIQVMTVPGHASHSLFFSVGGYYFIGEAACCTFEYDQQVYFRATTPIRFEMPMFLNSIDKLMLLPERPAFAGHSGIAYPSKWLLLKSREQLLRWHDLLASQAYPKEGEDEEAFLEHLVDTILKDDADTGPLGIWCTKKWERFFYKNSVSGFLDYIRRNKNSPAVHSR